MLIDPIKSCKRDKIFELLCRVKPFTLNSLFYVMQQSLTEVSTIVVMEGKLGFSCVVVVSETEKRSKTCVYTVRPPSSLCICM